MANTRTNSKEIQQNNLNFLIKEITKQVAGSAKYLAEVDTSTHSGAINAACKALESQEMVLKIPHFIKSKLGSFTTAKTAVFHIENTDNELSTIKIDPFKENDLNNIWRKTFVTFTHKNGMNEYYLINKSPELDNLFNQLLGLASMMKLVEFTMAKGMVLACESRVIPVNGWGLFDWENKDSHGLYYDKINDPMILDQFAKNVLPLKSTVSEGPLIVLDIGAGKGRVADKLINLTLSNNIHVRYILVEPTSEQINLARARLAHYSNNTQCEIVFIQSTLENLQLAEKANCIISSGGPLNMDIVTRITAKNNCNKLATLLCDNGFLIATGQTAVIIKSKHLQAAGLNVLSYATPCIIPEELKDHPFMQKTVIIGGFFNHFQRYVCQKNAKYNATEKKIEIDNNLSI